MFKYFLSSFALVSRKNMSSITSSKLKGKVAVVTASTDGIGFAVAKRLAADGASVVISSRKETNVRNASNKLQKEGLSVTGVVCHVAKKEDRERLFQEAIDKFGGIDILISNAAANPASGSILECGETEWDKIFDINVKSAFLLTKEVVPFLQKRSGGNIIYISSIAGYTPIEFLGPYSVSKTALLGLTKVFANDLASDNIRVNCVAPGIVQTKFSSIVSNISILFAQPPEIAGVVSFLCSDDASYITGETIVAAGGMVSRL
ncbi:unnamed protein product [Timema podura]|uniref:Dehydrogenase/reductase SDR family member 4 n=1 Tax=Timema podura TaxID=61482 RepID=A0ABN7NJM2_TIMPD|nr:unnamed protein product [Timema podura]